MTDKNIEEVRQLIVAVLILLAIIGLAALSNM